MKHLKFVLLSLSLAASAVAAQTIAVPAPLARPTALSAKVLQSVTDDIGAKYARYKCSGPLEQNIEAGQIDLGPQLRNAVVVKPKHNCLCGASNCRYWLFNGDAPIGRVNALSFKVNTAQTSQGGYELSAVSGSTGNTAETKVRYNGSLYIEQQDLSSIIPQN